MQSFSVLCIPTRGTHITSDMCAGVHISRGYTYHCDSGFSSLELPPAARKGGKQGTEGGDSKF